MTEIVSVIVHSNSVDDGHVVSHGPYRVIVLMTDIV